MRTLVIGLFVMASCTFAEGAGLSHIKTNITVYSPKRLSAPVMANWINERPTQVVTGSATLFPFKTPQYFYLDVYVLADFAQYCKYVDYLKVNGWSYEPTFLHAVTDYNSANTSITWSQADKFDRFENAKGIMRTANHVTYTDLTATAYNGSVTWQDTMYVGYELPFDQINLVVTSVGGGIARTWEYWDGTSWAALTMTDGTASFTKSGQIYFVPPASWSRTVVNGSRNKYFVRCRITAASSYPVTSSIKGDSWLNGSAQAARGWNATDAKIINSGTELEYNPSPPAGSSARFPYQARISAWSNNHFIMNPGNLQGGVSPWSKYLASVYISQYPLGFRGGYMDDLGGKPSNPPLTITDFVGTWSTTFLNHIHNVVSDVHAVHADMLMGGTNYYRSIFPFIDFSLQEYLGYVPHPADAQGILTSESSTVLQYDSYVPPYNPPDQRVGTNLPPKIGVMAQADLYDNLLTQYGIDYAWDRSNRGPILALAKHYIATNENTYFEYQTQNFRYDYIDEVLLKNGTTLNLADGVIPPVSTVSVWRKWFPAIEVNVGIPDVNGYNGGKRDLAWIVGPPSGDGRADVWRRDYTNAIILLRAAHYKTVAADMDNYYTPIDLGGETYYPLLADGTTTAGITSISLRAGEGAILMKARKLTAPKVILEDSKM